MNHWTFTDAEFAEFLHEQYENYDKLYRVTAENGQPQYESAIITRPKGDGILPQVEGRLLKVVNGKVNDPMKYAA